MRTRGKWVVVMTLVLVEGLRWVKEGLFKIVIEEGLV